MSLQQPPCCNPADVLSVNQIGIKEGQTTFLKSADSHQSGRLHPGLMFKQIEMSLFLKDRALSARYSGRGKQASWPTPSSPPRKITCLKHSLCAALYLQPISFQ
ncbi:MAG: hypothetical protein DWI00_12970 [Planctomycetota bacterium]|nr:MAG: hypothetical protein DWI00_12970 [Planctomycetota bacterium]